MGLVKKMIHRFVEKPKDTMSSDRVATNKGTVTIGEEVTALSKQNAWRREWVNC
jgi:hypothetical protein